MGSSTADTDQKLCDISNVEVHGEDIAFGSQGDAYCSIGIMARDFNISLRALRFYEDRGLLHPQRRGSTRLYTADDRQSLEMILRGKRLGFTLTEIHDIIHSRKDRAPVADLESTLQPDQIVAQIHHLERQREEIDEALVALRNAHQKLSEAWSLTGLDKGPSAPRCDL